ncbi:MAG TPA: hypothetical protein VLI90_00770, partial [Tepidisphaeraceae bacterium]|nr:hypothetical protein [Tepidisphaeraceae bacterium]
LGQSIFTYANVPYRIKPYEQIVRNPHDSIVFDHALDREIAARVACIGADGKLLLDSGDGQPYHVNLAEKLLVPLLAKVCNLVIDGGIWMNTQRPEWNDANNALAGNGLSVVTLCYLRRYVKFLLELLEPLAGQSVDISSAVTDWLTSTRQALSKTGVRRRQLLDELGSAFCAYRQRVYTAGVSGKTNVAVDAIADLLRRVFDRVDRSIRANRRGDGLYHSYNLLKLKDDEASVGHLPEMLEGQVAVLSSGCVNAAESLAILHALFKSRMYRPDQDSFTLYPDRAVPSFMDRNVIPDEQVAAIPLLQSMLEVGDTSIVARDADGVCRFNGDFLNAAGVRAAMDRLSYHSAADAVAQLFQEIFDHHRFIGRSGVMHGYEGLGCIYWHMVAKLLLATQEQFWAAQREHQPWETTLQPLAQMYYQIRQGLGFGKSAKQFGAFPTDPYSHTPPHSGARQPGMTGQVKEEILARFGELGLIVDDGCIRFHPILLRRREFLTQPTTWNFIDVNGDGRQLSLPAGSLGFSYCQVPIIYHLADEPMRIAATSATGVRTTTPADSLDRSTSAALFARDATIARIDVTVPVELLRLA